LVVAGYLGSLGLMANTHRGRHSVLPAAVARFRSSLARGASSSPLRLASHTAKAVERALANACGSRDRPSYPAQRRAHQHSASHVSWRPWLADACFALVRAVPAGVSMAKGRSPTLRCRCRALRPNHAVTPDAPSAWLLLASECAQHRTVARYVGAPVTLVR